MKNRRRQFLINKPLQFRYMASICGTLLVIAAIAFISLYIGIWSSILESFSDASVRNDLLTAARLTQYEQARYAELGEPLTALSLFKESEKLSKRQREIFKRILDRTNKQLILKLIILFILIAWGSVYLSHRMAGPLFRFHKTLSEIQQGNFRTRIHLRRFDEGKPLAENFNKTLVFLDDYVHRLKQIVQENKKNPERLRAHLKDELEKIKTSSDS